MKKYFIFSPGRTGSTLLSQVLKNYYNYKLASTENIIYYQNHNDLVPNWNIPIIHSHDLPTLEYELPEDYSLIINTRCIFDSVISLFIARATNHWHIGTSQEQQTYSCKFKNFKYTISIPEFLEQCRSNDFQYQESFLIATWRVNSDHYVIDYNNFFNNYNHIFKILDINFSVDHNTKYGSPMSIDKFSIIENLAEVYESYIKLNVKYKFNDEITLTRVREQYLL